MTKTLRCYADSADDAEVTALLRDRLVVGVTTNPEILQAAGVRLDALRGRVRGWVDAGAEEVYLQTWGATRDEQLANADRLRSFAPEIGVKVAATGIGFGVASSLVADGATVLLTAVYEPHQALYAASIGVRWIAPYLGRLDDLGRDGQAIIGEMASLVDGTATGVLAASIRTPRRLVDLAHRGVESFTAKPEVLRAALGSDASDSAAAVFERAMRSVS